MLVKIAKHLWDTETVYWFKKPGIHVGEDSQTPLGYVHGDKILELGGEL